MVDYIIPTYDMKGKVKSYVLGLSWQGQANGYILVSYDENRDLLIEDCGQAGKHLVQDDKSLYLEGDDGYYYLVEDPSLKAEDLQGLDREIWIKNLQKDQSFKLDPQEGLAVEKGDDRLVYQKNVFDTGQEFDRADVRDNYDKKAKDRFVKLWNDLQEKEPVIGSFEMVGSTRLSYRLKTIEFEINELKEVYHQERRDRVFLRCHGKQRSWDYYLPADDPWLVDFFSFLAEEIDHSF